MDFKIMIPRSTFWKSSKILESFDLVACGFDIENFRGEHNESSSCCFPPWRFFASPPLLCDNGRKKSKTKIDGFFYSFHFLRRDYYFDVWLSSRLREERAARFVTNCGASRSLSRKIYLLFFDFEKFSSFFRLILNISNFFAKFDCSDVLISNCSS